MVFKSMKDSMDFKLDKAAQKQNLVKNIITNLNLRLRLKSNEYTIYILIFFSLNSIFLIFTSHVNIDETFYIYGAKMVWDGFIPYRDFFYAQSPLMPYLYGLPLHFLGINLLNSRFVSFFFTLFSAIIIIKLAKNLNFEWVGIFTVFAMTISWFILYNFLISATYASTFFFIILSLYLLSTKINPIWKNSFSVIFMSIAGGIRLNMAVLGVFLAFWLLFMERKKKAIIYPIIAAVTLGIIYGPFFIMDYLAIHSIDRIYYNLLGFHVITNLTVNLALDLFTKLTFILFAVSTYGVISLLIILLPIYFLFSKIKRTNYKEIIKKYQLILLIFLIQILICGSYIMLITFFFVYSVTFIPLTILLIFIGISKFFSTKTLYKPTSIFSKRKNQKIIYLIIFILIPLSQIIQIDTWVLSRRRTSLFDRIVYNDLNQQQDIANIANIIMVSNGYIYPWDFILTFNPALALESKLHLLPGYEMAYFSYHFQWYPTSLTPISILYHLVNGEILYWQVQSNYTKLVIFSIAEISMTFLNELYGPRIMEVLNTSYNIVGIYPDSWNYNSPVIFYLRKA